MKFTTDSTMNCNTEILQFLDELSRNNNRQWFNANKERYEYLRKAWLHNIQQLIEQMNAYDPSLQGLDARDCVYRIYRDIRFSPNKLPYKTYLGAVIARGGRKTPKSCYYILFEPEHCGLFGGIWCPEQSILNALRHEIDNNIEEFLDIIDEPSFKSRYTLSGDSLKTMPKGFPKDLPHAKYIKMKEYLFSMPVADDYFLRNDWIERAASDFKPSKPLHDFLNYVFD